MTATSTGESAQAKLIGWLFALAILAHSLLIVVLPRMEKESAIRDAFRGHHYTIGILLLVLAIWRLWLWRKERGAMGANGLPGPVRFWHQSLAFALLLLIAAAGIFGFFQGWTEGRELSISGLIPIPALMGPDHAAWKFSGYFHSALGFATLFVSIVAVLSAAYSYARYGKGLFAAFPAGFGFLFFARFVIGVYAVNSFKQIQPGLIAAAVVLAIAAAFWAIVRAVRKGRSAASGRSSAGATARSVAVLATGAIAVLGLWGPNLFFRVTPFASGVVVEAEPSITWHVNRVAEVELTPETAFERTTGQETYKWCQFCHTMEPGGAHLVGPNLHNIFGQQAGTVPNFYYSPELAKAGQEGLVWTEETITQYIAGPDDMVPGTTMIISSGNVTDPEIQKAVINALKRDTMGDPQE